MLTANHNWTEPSRWFDGVQLSWQRFSLVQRFTVAGGIVMIVAMFVIGSWVSDRIEEGVVRNSATSTALYMDSFISPLSQELATSNRLSEVATTALELILENTPIREKVLSVKIWKQDGLIAYSSDQEIIGQRFETTDELQAAWNGMVSAELEDFDEGIWQGAEDDVEHGSENQFGIPMLEVYSPIRDGLSGKVIAVAEFYEAATQIHDELFWVRLNSWMVVGAVMFMTAALLYGIVLAGSRTIERQRATLERQLKERDELARQNERLTRRAQRASARSTELGEQYLRRIGADLHDGPAQILALAALRMDKFAKSDDPAKMREASDVIRQSIRSAMEEIRSISRGLALPNIEDLTFAELVNKAAAAHRRATGSEVAVELSNAADVKLPEALNICFYRVAQEGLSNAFRHGDGKNQQLSASFDGVRAKLAVSDRGPGFEQNSEATSDRLGLPGLRERVESLGGEFTIDSRPGEGTRLTVEAEVNYDV